jgi:16S rRNA (cytosine1402-N4)-methyltransferase
VLLRESVDALNVRTDGVYLDCTAGLGGHSAEIAARLSSGRLIAVDRDASAIESSAERLAPYSGKVTLVRANFGDARGLLARLGVAAVDGLLADFGVSSPQLDDPERGFSYMRSAPLDMRMDGSSTLTAYEIVNGWDERELRRIIYEYGEERYGARIAAAIVRGRARRALETSDELVAVIKSAVPGAALREAQHPAKRTFQALRIAVNDELGEIGRLLASLPELISPGGRAVFITFHSLEDRLVKNAFRSFENGCTCPKEFPVCVCGFKQTFRTLTKKPVTPRDAEVAQNPRARSAKLRAAERTPDK